MLGRRWGRVWLAGGSGPVRALTFPGAAPKSPAMSEAATALILSEPLAGLQAQAMGLAEAARLPHELRALSPRAPWKWVAARLWPRPLVAVAESLRAPLPELVIGCGGMAAAVAAALRRGSRPVVQVQNPRMDPRRFDLIVANHHDELTGPNVMVTRTALHRVTPERLAAEAERWRDRFAHLPRPLVAVLLGGSNGRYRLDAGVGAQLAGPLAAMMRRDRVGLVVTPSRRTDPAAVRVLRAALEPLGAYVWDGTGDNPYFGMLALADLIVVTQDSVSMISEAAATTAPVLVAALPGRSRRQGLFLEMMRDEDRVRWFDGRFATWQVAPLDDTPAAAAECADGWDCEADGVGSGAHVRPGGGKCQGLCPWTLPGGFAPWTPSKGRAFAIHPFGWVDGRGDDALGRPRHNGAAGQARRPPSCPPSQVKGSKGSALGGDPRGRAPWWGFGGKAPDASAPRPDMRTTADTIRPRIAQAC